MGWRSLSRSVVGTRHQHRQLPCQDAGGSRVLGDMILGAIADGAGSASQGEMGAILAINATLDYLTNLEQWLQPNDQHPGWPTLVRSPTHSQIKRLFERTTRKVREALKEQAEENSYDFEDLATTLLAFVATPHWFAAMQIGDGFIVGSVGDGTYQLMFQPDKGEFVNQTAFVTASTALEDLQVRAISGAPQFICAATDAFERLALKTQDWSTHPPFFKPLEEYLLETPSPEDDDAYIMGFLDSEYLNSHTDDDKTLLLCLNEVSALKPQARCNEPSD
jgi:serine/threonine protein phosphatase PrpC